MRIKSECDHIEETKAKLLDEILPHVAFDGWSLESFQAAAESTGIDPSLIRSACPRGAIDLAVAFHKKFDREMISALAQIDLNELRIRDRVTLAIRSRIELVAHEAEAVRRGVTLFALPHNMAEGLQLGWETADAIWTALGDRSTDYNYYTKRGILAGVYSSTVLYWLGDQSDGFEKTWAFLDRRIGNIMQFEKVKSRVQSSIVGRAIGNGFGRFFGSTTKAHVDKTNLPGYVSDRK